MAKSPEKRRLGPWLIAGSAGPNPTHTALRVFHRRYPASGMRAPAILKGKSTLSDTTAISADQYLKAAQAAKLLSMSTATLARWRMHGLGPDYIKISATVVRYSRAAIERWLAERRTTSTSDDAAARRYSALDRAERASIKLRDAKGRLLAPEAR